MCTSILKKKKKAACLFADCARQWGAECEEPLQEQKGALWHWFRAASKRRHQADRGMSHKRTSEAQPCLNTLHINIDHQLCFFRFTLCVCLM